MRIIITGTPGTGKTSLAKFLEGKEFEILNLDPILEKCEEGWDKKRKSKIINENCFREEIEKILEKKDNIVIESHLSHFISPKYIDLCIVLRCDPKILRERLRKKGWDKKKIDENVEAEILDVVLIEAEEIGHRIYEIDTTNKKIEEIGKEVLDAINKKLERKGVVDWTFYLLQ